MEKTALEILMDHVYHSGSSQSQEVLNKATALLQKEKDRDELNIQLLELKIRIDFYKKLDKKIDRVLQGFLQIGDWQDEAYVKLRTLESEYFEIRLESGLLDEDESEDY